jgi:hypothetical protein
MKTFLLTLLLLTPWATVAWADKPIEVMVTGTSIRGSSPYLQKYIDACAQEGVDVHFVLAGPGMDFTAITLDEMKKYDVIVYTGSPVSQGICKGTAEEAQAFRDNLEKFRQMGGGLIWMPTSAPTASPCAVDDWNQAVGAKYGVKLVTDKVWDPQNIINATPPDSPLRRQTWYQYNWTTAITPHPVTAGVRGLLLPIRGDWLLPPTIPFVGGPEWKVIVNGMPTAKTVALMGKYEGGTPKYDEAGNGAYAASPAIVAVRDGEGAAGRMMVFPIYTTYTFQNFGSPLMFDAVMKNGAEGHPSDGHRLLLNAYKWLAEPAVASGKLGIGDFKVKHVSEMDYSPIDWKTAIPFDPGAITGNESDGKIFKGLFGVRSLYGGGTGTVADYVAEAKKQGLSFLVFMDDTAKMKDDQYQKLIADCKKCSDSSFLAMPGYSVRDEWGNDYFMTDEKHAPDPTFLNQEGLLTNFWGLDKQSRTNLGFCLWWIGHWPVHPWFAAKFHIIAPYTYEGNKLVDDGLTRYCELQGTPHSCTGVSVSVLTSPSQLAQAVKDTHLTVIQAADLTELQGDIDEQHSLKANGVRPIYITNGPVIETWGIRHTLRADFRPGGDRFQLELKVKSDAGIQEVKFIECNTGQPYRIYHPQGQKEFSCIIDESNSHQFYLVPQITDGNGRTALGSSLWTVEPGTKIQTMGDRLMSTTTSEAYDPKQDKTVQVDNSLGMMWTKGKIDAGDLRPNVDSPGSKIWGFDGGAIAVGELHVSRKVTTSDGIEPIVSGAARQINNLAAYDAGVIDFIENQQYEKEHAPAAGYIVMRGVPVDTRVVDISIRDIGLRATINAPTIAREQDVTVRFKKDTQFNRLDLFNLQRQYPKTPPLWFIRDSAGEVAKALDKGESFSRTGTLRTGDYICPANEMGGPVGVINLGPQEVQYRANETGAQLFVDGKGKAVKAGDTITVRLITLGRNREMQDNPAWLKDYARDYGIDGSKPAYDPVVTQGQVISSDFALDLKAVDGGTTFSTKKADIPDRVLVRVDGLPAHGVYGRYDIDQKQLRIVPWYTGKVYTSIKPAKTANHLYVGEIFHCDDPDIITSAVQDGPDNLLVEINNPTDKSRAATISSAPGFAPLAGLKETINLGPGQSVKRTWKTSAGSLVYQPDVED